MATSPRQIRADDVGLPVYETQRAPAAGDDASKGLPIGSYWQYNKLLWKSTTATAAAAVWASQTPASSFLADAAGLNKTAVLGTVKLVASYAGPCLEAVKASDGATVTLPFTDGVCDTALLGGGVGYVTKVYHQNDGTGATFSTASGATRPTIGGKTLNGAPCITFDPSVANQYLTLPASVSVDRRNVTVLQVGQAGHNGGMLFGFGAGLDMCLFRSVGPTLIGGTIQFYGGGTFGDTCTPQYSHGLHLHGLASSASGVTYFSDETTAAGAIALPSGSYTGGVVGASEPATTEADRKGAANIQAFLVLGGVASPAQLDAIRQTAFVQFNIAPQIRTTVVITGDSQSECLKAPAAGWPLKVAAQLDRPIKLINNAVSGMTAAAAADPWITSCYAPGRNNLALIFLGANDVNQNGTANSASLTAVQARASAAKKAGFRVLAHTFLPRTVYPSGSYANGEAYNDMVRDGWRAWADGFVDWSKLPVVGPLAAASDPSLYPDGTHLGAGAMDYVVPATAAAINHTMRGLPR